MGRLCSHNPINHIGIYRYNFRDFSDRKKRRGAVVKTAPQDESGLCSHNPINYIGIYRYNFRDFSDRKKRRGAVVWGRPPTSDRSR